MRVPSLIIAGALLVAAVASATEPPPRFVLQWGSFGSGNGQFNNALGIATDPGGNVYVADTGNFHVQK